MSFIPSLWRNRSRSEQSTVRRLNLESLEDRLNLNTYTVNMLADIVNATDGRLSLREAITAANAHPGADIIVLPTGLLRLQLTGAGEDANATGDFDITDSVTITGAGSGSTIIDGQQNDRIFDVLGTTTSSIRAIFEKLTIQNGSTTDSGGGIQVNDANLIVRDSIITANRASEGGGISIIASSGTRNATLVRSTVSFNTASNGGGGVRVGADGILLTLNNSTVRRNSGSEGGGIEAPTITLNSSAVNGNIAVFGGGGITATTATLTNSTVSRNHAGSGTGGGINATTVTLTGSTVSGNSATEEGGGIRAATATLTRSTLSGNAISNGFGGGGLNAGTATLTNCTVNGNTARGTGGGIEVESATLTNCTVSGNSATGNGGGIDAFTTLTLINSTVSGNTSLDGTGGGINAVNTLTLTRSTVNANISNSDGGGINAATATLTNSTISGNSAAGNGGGLAITAGGNIQNCTIVENLGLNGGGVFRADTATQDVQVRNTIIALNLARPFSTGPDVNGTFASLGSNLLGDVTGSTGFDDPFIDFFGSPNDPLDPLILPLANNGGPTKTHALRRGSLAVENGNDANVPPTDQRGAGFPRNKDGNGDGIPGVDIGAYER